MEAVVSRMKTVQVSITRESSAKKNMQAMRILAVSATIPNVDDVSKCNAHVYPYQQGTTNILGT